MAHHLAFVAKCCRPRYSFVVSLNWVRYPPVPLSCPLSVALMLVVLAYVSFVGVDIRWHWDSLLRADAHSGGVEHRKRRGL